MNIDLYLTPWSINWALETLQTVETQIRWSAQYPHLDSDGGQKVQVRIRRHVRWWMVWLYTIRNVLRLVFEPRCSYWLQTHVYESGWGIIVLQYYPRRESWNNKLTQVVFHHTHWSVRLIMHTENKHNNSKYLRKRGFSKASEQVFFNTAGVIGNTSL